MEKALWVRSIIVNTAEKVWSPTNIKGADKGAKIYVGRSTEEFPQSFVLRSYTIHKLGYENVSYVNYSVTRKQQQQQTFISPQI